jgi:hypothetical protein
MGMGSAGGDAHLEELEQRLIQSVKTSGVRQQRETALVEQLLELRRGRRQMGAGLRQRVAALEAQQADLVGQLERASGELEQRARERRDLEQHMEARAGEEARRAERGFKAKLDEYTSRRDASMKKYVSTIKDKYDSQISLLEGKLGQISDEYRSKLGESVQAGQARQIATLSETAQGQAERINR